MRNILILLATVGGFLLAGGAAQARDNYGAIAYSPSTGSHGYSYDYPSRRSAERKALAACRKHAGDCQVPIWFRNACGALAVGNAGGWGTGWGSSRNLAERYALQTCRKYTGGCSVIRWVCTTR